MTAEKSLNPAPPLLELRNCSVLRGGRAILDDVSLSLAPGRHTAIVGPNGSGKSTLIRLLMREYYPAQRDGDDPVMLFEGRDAWAQVDLRQRIALVSAALADALLTVPGMDVFDAVATSFFGTYGFYGHDALNAAMKKQVRAVMDALDLTPCAGQSVGTLSSGQLRKVLIACAMVLKPALILLDEPTQGLDIAAQDDFLSYLGRAASDATIVMVTHHLEEIIPAVRDVLLMKDGRVFACGPKDQVLTNENLSALFGVKIGVRISQGGVRSMHRL